MSLADEARARARERTTHSVELRVATTLKQKWNSIRLAAQQLKPPVALPEGEPTAAEFERMARELIDDRRELTLDGRIVRLADLDTHISPEIRSGMGITSFANMVPTRTQIALISHEVEEGVTPHTTGLFGGANWGQVFKGFLRCKDEHGWGAAF